MSCLCRPFIFYFWRRKWQPTPIFLPGESYGWRSLVGYNPRGHKESDTTEPLHFTSLHFNQLPYSGKPSWLFLSFIFLHLLHGLWLQLLACLELPKYQSLLGLIVPLFNYFNIRYLNSEQRSLRNKNRRKKCHYPSFSSILKEYYVGNCSLYNLHVHPLHLDPHPTMF